MSSNRIIVPAACLAALALLTIPGWLLIKRTWASPLKSPGGGETEAVTILSRPLPAYQVVTPTQQEVPSDELRRGRVLLIYLTTSCNPCIEEAKNISGIRENMPPDVRVYAMSVEKPSEVAAFITKVQPAFPVLIDVGGKLARTLDIRYFPTKYLVEDGVLTKVWQGKTEDAAEFLRQLNAR